MKMFFLPLMLMILLLTGCGNEQSNNPDNATNSSKIIIGIDDEIAPLAFYNERNELVGFDIDLAKEAGKRLGVEMEFKPIDWDKKREELTSGNVDLIWNGLNITAERKEYMIFTAPYMDDRQIFLVSKGNKHNIHSEGDLEGKIVGVQTGSSAEVYFNENETLKRGFKEFKSYGKFTEAVNALNAGEIDVFVCDELVARYEIKRNPDRFEIIDARTGYAIEMAIGFRKDDTALRDRVQKVFSEMIADGTAKKISEEWFQADLIKLQR